MKRFETFRGRLAIGLALVTTTTAVLVFGVPSSSAGLGLRLDSVADGEQPAADLAVDIRDSSDPVRVGQDFHYNIRIRNLGPDDATGVGLVDSLPKSFELMDATGAKECNRDGDVYCELNDIPANGSLEVILHVRAKTPGTFTDTATASSSVQDPNSDDNTATESTTVLGPSQDDPSGHLVVVEQVVNDNGGSAAASDFQLAVKGGAPDPAQFKGNAEGTDVTLAPGSYAVSQESALGYLTTLSSDCEGTIAAGETKTCTVSNDDIGSVTLALAADTQSVSAGSTAEYTATLHNPNSQQVAVSNLAVTFGGTFVYKAGSTSGSTTADPQITSVEGGNLVLTWAGPLEITGHKSAIVHFSVKTPTAAGDYDAGIQANVDVPFTVTTGSTVVKVVPPSSTGSSPGSGGSTSTGTDPSTTTTTTTTTAPTVAPPEFQKSADVEPVSGEVLIRQPGTTAFVPLTAETQVAFGSEIDATDGRVAMTTVDANGTLYHANFYEGRFVMAKELGNGITVLKLSGSSFRSCTSAKRTLAAYDKQKPKKAKKKHKKKTKRSRKVVRHLWGSGEGKFRTTGRYIAATVHGTTWLVEDRCDGTRAFVQQGVVDVRDLVKHKTIQLGAGQSYVARPGH